MNSESKNKTAQQILKEVYKEAPEAPETLTLELGRMYILQAMEIYKQQNEHCDCEQYYHTYTVTLEKCEHCDNVVRKRTTGQKVGTLQTILSDEDIKTKSKWEPPVRYKRPVVEGDVSIVKLPVKVLFEWSDKIIADYDSETDTILEYKSGYVMKVLPKQSFVYKNEEAIFIANTVKA